MKSILAVVAVFSLVSSAAFACPQLGSAQGVSYSKVEGSGSLIGDDQAGDVYFNPSSFMLVQNDCSLRMVTDGATYDFSYDDSSGQFSTHYNVAWFDFTLTVAQATDASQVSVSLTRQRDFWQSSAPTYGYSADFEKDSSN